MRREDCFQLGHISRTHGYKGEVVAVFDTDRPQAYTELGSVLIERDEELVPFLIAALSQNSKGHFILRLEGLSSEEAPALVGAELWLPLSMLPPLEGNNFYYHEVVGFGAFAEGEGKLGTIKRVWEGSAQALLVIEGPEGEEILVPAVDAFIEGLDRLAREMHLKLPDGLLALYRP